MKEILKFIEAFNKYTFIIEKKLLILAVIIMVSVNFIQVVFRYILHSSIPWSEQLSVVLFMFMILIGGNIAIKDDGEIKIEIIKFKNKYSDAKLRLIADIIAFIALILLLLGSIFLTKQSIELPRSLSALPLKYHHLYIFMVIGFFLMLIEKMTNILKRIILIMSNTNQDRR